MAPPAHRGLLRCVGRLHHQSDQSWPSPPDLSRPSPPERQALCHRRVLHR
jgi:hypothetical protein